MVLACEQDTCWWARWEAAFDRAGTQAEHHKALMNHPTDPSGWDQPRCAWSRIGRVSPGAIGTGPPDADAPDVGSETRKMRQAHRYHPKSRRDPATADPHRPTITPRRTGGTHSRGRRHRRQPPLRHRGDHQGRQRASGGRAGRYPPLPGRSKPITRGLPEQRAHTPTSLSWVPSLRAAALSW